MPKVKYKDVNLRAEALAIVEQANIIIEEYQEQGFSLTLRQLFYQFVSRSFIENTVQSYKRLGTIISDGRLAGLIDWEAIEDRTRNLESLATWNDPEDLVSACADQFRNNLWGNQENVVEVWIEKEALAGVFEQACAQWRTPYFCCRGYTSQSEMWVAAMRLKMYVRRGQRPIILHFGDHDPSGIDMTRDITDRLEMFMGGLRVNRLALNMDQVEEYEPPPNPAKVTDPRAGAYIKRFGDESWELDALDPTTLAQLVQAETEKLVDIDKWNEALAEETAYREMLTSVSERFDDVRAFLREG